MKLLYIIPTRGRPLNLLGTISTAWRLRSGKHDIQFGISMDGDDPERFRVIDVVANSDLQERVTFAIDNRPDALGAKWNWPISRDAEPYVPIHDIDCVLLMTDRIIPVTPGWDDAVARCLELHPDRVLWWRSPIDPGTVAPVMPRSWLEAMDWKPAVEAYPYWFIDTHLMELDRFVSGEPSLMMPVFYAGERKETQQLRDCEFWCRYFAALRPARIEQAKVIAASLGLFWQDRPELLAEFGSQDAIRIQRAAEFEKHWGDPSEPWEGYARIYRKAQHWMTSDGPWATCSISGSTISFPQDAA